MSDYRIYEARAAIAQLPGKTHRPWKDGDARGHCSHCRLCGECYPTRVVTEHEKECTDALLSALQALSWYRSRVQGPAGQPAPTETGPLESAQVRMSKTLCGPIKPAPQGAPLGTIEEQADRCFDCGAHYSEPHATTCKQHARW